MPSLTPTSTGASGEGSGNIGTEPVPPIFEDTVATVERQLPYTELLDATVLALCRSRARHPDSEELPSAEESKLSMSEWQRLQTEVEAMLTRYIDENGEARQDIPVDLRDTEDGEAKMRLADIGYTGKEFEAVELALGVIADVSVVRRHISYPLSDAEWEEVMVKGLRQVIEDHKAELQKLENQTAESGTTQ